MDYLFKDLEQRLNNAKSQQDPYFSDWNFKKLYKIFDLFKNMKYELSIKANA